MEKQATYRIRVYGCLDPSWSDRLSGVTISNIGGKDMSPTTILEGPLLDQGALVGIINTLYDLGLVLISVECLQSTASAMKSVKNVQDQPAVYFKNQKGGSTH